MANIPIPENDDSLELNVRYQPDMVLEGMLDATVPEMKYLRLSQGNETHDLLGAQSGDQILELLSEDLTSADNGKVLTATYGGIEGEETGSVVWGRVDRLPVIGSGDAGKVLTVNAGETGTEWAVPSGGGGKVTVTHQLTSGGTRVNTFVWSHTVAQIADMLNNGITPILEYNMLDDNGDPAPITPIYIPYTGCVTTFGTVNSIAFVSDVFLEVDPDTNGWIMKKTAILYTAQGTDLQEEQFVLMPD